MKGGVSKKMEENSKAKSPAGDSKTLFQKLVHKVSPKTNRIYTSYVFELKDLNGTKFCQITQEKQPYGTRPFKRTSITFDPSNVEFVEVLKELLSESKKA